MGLQIAMQRISRGGKLNQAYFQASLSSMLHSWDHILITRYQNYAIHGLFVCISRNIQTNTHVNALLLKHRGKVRIG